MEKPIPRTNGKYVISDKGIIRNTYKNRIINIHVNSSPLNVGVSIFKGMNRKFYTIRTLMTEAFELNPPDNFHHYVLVNEDNNPLNNELSNLKWKIQLKKGSGNYYPQPFYDEEGNITEKICIKCGNKKDISDFILQKHPGKKGVPYKNTYKNACISCISKRNRERILESPEAAEKIKLLNKKYYFSEKGNKYHKEYRKIYEASEKGKAIIKANRLKSIKSLTDGYVKGCLAIYTDDFKLTHADIPQELVELQRKQLTIKRQIENEKIKQSS
jgi:hypothetical protein